MLLGKGSCELLPPGTGLGVGQVWGGEGTCLAGVLLVASPAPPGKGQGGALSIEVVSAPALPPPQRHLEGPAEVTGLAPKISSIRTCAPPSLRPAQPPGAGVTHPHVERTGGEWGVKGETGRDGRGLLALAQEGKRPEVKGERRPQALPPPASRPPSPKPEWEASGWWERAGIL